MGPINACRMPITGDDKQSEHYVRGVSCPYCYSKTTPEQRERFAEQQSPTARLVAFLNYTIALDRQDNR